MSRPRVVIVGAGFAGYRTARTLSRLPRNKADIVLLNPTDHSLCLPLLPQVAAGVLEPRRVTVSLTGTRPGVRLVLGEADGTLSYDRLVPAVGSVNELLPVPGVAEHAHGFRGLPEALYPRDPGDCPASEPDALAARDPVDPGAPDPGRSACTAGSRQAGGDSARPAAGRPAGAAPARPASRGPAESSGLDPVEPVAPSPVRPVEGES